MSTKMTVAYNNPDYDNKDGSDYHLYLECFEKGAVYLELRGKDIGFEASNNHVTVRIPKDVFDEISSGKHKDVLKDHDSNVEELVDDYANR